MLIWLNKRLPFLSFWHQHVLNYYVPKNLNVLYVFGVLGLVALSNQFLTGLWLLMFYIPTAEQAFSSIEYIMRDVHFGWLFRYFHVVGASAFFVVLYIHIFRSLLYGSYQKPRELVWLIGVVIFCIAMAEAFFGYLLPWGQMSYWGAQVITSLFGVIPFLGDNLVLWLRGDYVVSGITLQRFFALHSVALPFMMIFLVILHIISLRAVGSNNPEGIDISYPKNKYDNSAEVIAFHPYFTVKDFLACMTFLWLLCLVIFFKPDLYGLTMEHANFEPAKAWITPADIHPMWYFAPFYSMLRVIPHKLLGILIAIASIIMLFLLPWLDKSSVRSMRYKGQYSRLALYLMVISFILAGVMAFLPLTYYNQKITQLCIIGYFAYFLLMPFYTKVERIRPLPKKITL
ncbi:MAG: cytochrome b [Legionellaceae bacterium]|nr:cytochrome b [Legionellaceae bacterium]HCA89576.1 cytochrome b [Legionellales bacterium]